MSQTIRKLTDSILLAARSEAGDLTTDVIDDLRNCPPELVEVVIRRAMAQEPTFSDWIRMKFLDHMFPFPRKDFSISGVT